MYIYLLSCFLLLNPDVSAVLVDYLARMQT